jgi:hypothetical protein
LMVRELEPEALALAPSVLAQGLRGEVLERWALVAMEWVSEVLVSEAEWLVSEVLLVQEAEELVSEGRWHV